MREKSRRPSPLQRRVLIVLAALDAKRPGPVATRDIERVLEQGGDAPVYGPNLRASCRRMEAAGWLRTLRAPNLQLAVELTEAGRGIAEPLYQEAREAEKARQRLTDVRRLPLRQTAAGDAVELQLGDGRYSLREAAYVPSGRYHLPAADGCRRHTPDKRGRSPAGGQLVSKTSDKWLERAVQGGFG